MAILRSSINKKNSININTENKRKEEEKKLLIKELQLKYNKKIEEFFTVYEKMVDSKIKGLLSLIDEKDFNQRVSSVDTEIKLYIKDMYKEIYKEIEGLNKEISEIIKYVLDDLECNIEQ